LLDFFLFNFGVLIGLESTDPDRAALGDLLGEPHSKISELELNLSNPPLEEHIIEVQ
jgi:hypothetical protein